MSDFISALKVGVKAAKDLHKHELEIDEVFNELARAMRNATGGKLTIIRSTSTISAAAAAMDTILGAAPRVRTGADGGVYMSEVSGAKKSVRVANWVKQAKGFNFSLQFDSREIITRSKVELSNALTELLSSPVVGVAYLSLTNPSSSTGSGSSNSVSVVAKTAAKPAAKPTAVKAVAKPASRKVAAKPAAKPTAAKAVAKPAAKPTAAKAVAKPAAKPTAAKAVAKPAAKPTAAKAAAKPAAAKPTKPTASKPAGKASAVANSTSPVPSVGRAKGADDDSLQPTN
ncbi:hypothetical protein [Pseudomonas uvaldensis]|uniref:hypothetical protein n=1 Tax=Pseudomonas uvaldensis TaxID=2878385 RepID=UPI001E31429D|nr:hypothetical protein [Pseudomonas uvaldensis]MCE0459985.1 hypothetical protein [Pseudomonas uvaldensis]